MTIHNVAAIDPVEVRTTLNDAMRQEGYTAQRAAQTEAAMEGALNQALKVPGLAGSGTSGAMAAERGIAEVKREIVAGKETAITDAAAEIDPAQAQMDAMTDRLSRLYSEMTNWQVAWSIATRTQQDTNHLLRGS